jgi:hypothetical protein
LSALAGILHEKRPGLLQELELADPRLAVVVYTAAVLSVRMFGVVPVLTRVNGTPEQTIRFHGETPHPARPRISPHEVRPCRAADLRARGLLTPEQAQQWEDELDKRFEYAPSGRHSVAYYETQEKELAAGRNPSLPPVVPHLHVQVPGWTIASLPVVRLWSMGSVA